MPLIPRDNGGEVEVEIDGDVYWLKRYLNWWELEQCNSSKGIAMHMKMSDAMTGRFAANGDALVPITIDNTEGVKLRKLQIWIKRWSHVEAGRAVPLTVENIKRIDPRHVARLEREIARLEKDQRGPAADSPLASSANGSSMPSSSKAEPSLTLAETTPN